MYGNYPRTIRFEMADLRRIPLEMDEATRRRINQSGDPGRHLPQAVEEMFGLEPDIASARLEWHQEDDSIHVILLHNDVSLADHRFTVAGQDLNQVNRGQHERGFDHLGTCQRARQSYRQARGLDFSGPAMVDH